MQGPLTVHSRGGWWRASGLGRTGRPGARRALGLRQLRSQEGSGGWWEGQRTRRLSGAQGLPKPQLTTAGPWGSLTRVLPCRGLRPQEPRPASGECPSLPTTVNRSTGRSRLRTATPLAQHHCLFQEGCVCVRSQARAETCDHPSLSPLEGGLPLCAGCHSGLRGAGLPVAGEDPGARGSLRPGADRVRHHRLPRPQGVRRQPAGALATEDRGWTLLLAPLTGFTGWAESFRPSAQSQG